MVLAALVLYMHTTLHNKCTGNHLYSTHSTHTWQTHAHTPSSSCHHVLKDLGQDPGYCRRGRLGWRIAARHPERSMINSCQSVTPERSLLTTSHHRSGAPPGGLLLPLGWHFNTCFWMQLSGILQICPRHCSRLCLSWSSTGSSPVLSRISVFRSMFQQVIPRTSLKHLI